VTAIAHPRLQAPDSMQTDFLRGPERQHIPTVKVAVQRYPVPANALQLPHVHAGKQVYLQVSVYLTPEQKIIKDGPLVAITGIDCIPVYLVDKAR
jgi:hypothetical protein